MAVNVNVARVYAYDDDHYTYLAGAAITGSRFVKGSTGGLGNKPTAVLCGAGDRSIGVSGRDTAVGADVAVYSEGIVGVTGSGAITSGTWIAAGANGVAVAATGTAVVLGQATQDTADGGNVPVQLLGM